jgi:hypothetical protein
VNRRFLTIALILTGVGLAVSLIRGVARDTVVVPLLSLIWGVVLLIESLPQPLVWFTLVFLGVILAFRSMADSPKLLRGRRFELFHGGRVAEWARLASHSRRDPYSRWRMAQRLALLAAELLAHRHGGDIRVGRRLVEAGEGLSPEVRDYLWAGLGPQRSYQRGLRGLFQRARRGDPLELDPQRAAEEIEKIL